MKGYFPVSILSKDVREIKTQASVSEGHTCPYSYTPRIFKMRKLIHWKYFPTIMFVWLQEEKLF